MHKKRAGAESSETGRTDAHLPEAERIRESDGPRKRERAEARRNVPFRDGPAEAVEGEREAELDAKLDKKDRVEDERTARRKS